MSRPATPRPPPPRPGTPGDLLSVKRLLESRPSSPLPLKDKSKDEDDHSTFHETKNDLQTVLLGYLRLLPFLPKDHPIRVRLKRILAPPTDAVVHFMATALHKRHVLASNLAYDCAVLFWKWVVNLFFREIRPRGAYKIPKDGALIFVAGPHHNQFVDPLLLMSEARLSASRRISFLTAAASMQRAFVGAAARTMQSIPVVRSADNAVPGAGLLYIQQGDEPNVLRGYETKFTEQLKPRSQVQMPKELDYQAFEVDAIVSDTEIRLKKEFKDGRIKDALVAAGKRIHGTNTADFEETKGIKLHGIQYRTMPHVDQTKMYSAVYQKLKEGGCIGIFPEGGSHDRTDLLPLKAGVAIMALGALQATPGLKVQIVPTGMSYFHPNKFRSRAVVEFGSPITIPQNLVDDFAQGGEKKREAIGKVLDLVVAGLRSVTVRAPDYETLMLIQATRRLYRPPGQQLTLGQVVELNKRFIIGYERYKDDPRVIALKQKVGEYNQLLNYMGLKDHQVEKARPFWRSLILLVYRSLLVSAWGSVALPGVILNAPMFVACTIISRKKQKQALAASTVKIQARDVVATWKILVSLGMSPLVYTIYGCIAMYFAFKYNLSRRYKVALPFFMAIALPSIGYSALKFGEVGMDIYKSLRPLFVSIMPGNTKYINQLREKRAELSEELSSLVEELGPKVFDDFEPNRVLPGANIRQDKKQSYGRQNAMLNHPFEWLDDKLWRGDNDPQDPSSLDYDHIISTVGSRPPNERRKSSSSAVSKGRSAGLQLDMGKASALEDRDSVRQR